MHRWPAGAAALLLVVLGACGDAPDGPEPSPSPPATTSPSPDPPSPSPSPPAAGERIDLDDGRHAVFIRELSIRDRRLTVDVVQFLTGEEAARAYQRDFPEDEGGPPNDYYLVNENPRLRSGTITPDAEVRLVNLEQDSDADLDESSLEELQAYLDRYEDPVEIPFWIEVSSGLVTGIEEQYIP